MTTNHHKSGWIAKLILALLTVVLYFIFGVPGLLTKVLIILALLVLLVFVARVFIFCMTRD